MTQYDPKLLDVAAAAHWAIEGGGSITWEELDHEARECRLMAMAKAIDAINASRIAWVAPWLLSEEMRAAWGTGNPQMWGVWRDAYLTEQKEHPAG